MVDEQRKDVQILTKNPYFGKKYQTIGPAAQ
jgi:hypothetical protein